MTEAEKMKYLLHRVKNYYYYYSSKHIRKHANESILLNRICREHVYIYITIECILY
jgi:hypothetical protein